MLRSKNPHIFEYLKVVIPTRGYSAILNDFLSFLDPPRRLLGFGPWYLRWREFRWTLLRSDNHYGHIVHIWSTGVAQSWEFCHFYLFREAKNGKIFDFRQHLLTTCAQYDHNDYRTSKGSIWTLFTSNIMVQNLIVVSGGPKNSKNRSKRRYTPLLE